MSDVVTRDEAMAVLGRSLHEYARDCSGVWTIARAQLTAAMGEIDAEVGRRATELQVAEHALAVCRDERAVAALRASVRRATVRLDAARRAQSTVRRAEQDFRRHESRARSALDRVPPAGAEVARMAAALEDYHGAGSSGAGSSGAPVVGTPTALDGASGAPSGLDRLLAEKQLVELELADVDFSDNPVLDGFTRGGLTKTDYLWLVETWDTVVRPGIDRGLTRDDFAARDAADEARPTRRTVDVWDSMLGSDAVRVSRRGDGTWDVVGGRHRIEVARELGQTTLPARLS